MTAAVWWRFEKPQVSLVVQKKSEVGTIHGVYSWHCLCTGSPRFVNARLVVEIAGIGACRAEGGCQAVLSMGYGGFHS